MNTTVIISGICLISGSILAHVIVKKKIAFWFRMVVNVLLLLVSGVVVFVTGARDSTCVIYIGILLFTLMGIVTRIVSPVIFNFIEMVMSKITHDEYKKKSYEEIMQEDEEGDQRGLRAVWMPTTYKTFFYLLLLTDVLRLLK